MSRRHIGVFDQWLGHGMWDHKKLLVLVIVVIFLALLCALDKIDSWSLTSAASVALAVVFNLVAFVVAFVKLVEGKIEAPRMTSDFGSKKAILEQFWIYLWGNNSSLIRIYISTLIALKLSKEGINLGFGKKLLSWFMLMLAIIVSATGVIGNVYSINIQSE